MADFSNSDAFYAAWKKGIEDEELKDAAHTAAEGKLVAVTATANQQVKDATGELSEAKDAEDAAHTASAANRNAFSAAMDAVLAPTE